MRKLLNLLLSLVCALWLALPCAAATRQPVSQDYIDKYFTSVAAASCLGCICRRIPPSLTILEPMAGA